MGRVDYISEISLLGKVLGAIVAICGGLWFFGEPFLEDYVESHFEAYDVKHKKENSNKLKLRDLLSEKMGIPSDEVHIELGRMFQSEKPERDKIWETIEHDYKYNKDKRNLIINEIKYIYPGTALRLE